MIHSEEFIELDDVFFLNRKAPNFNLMVKTMVKPVKIFPTKPMKNPMDPRRQAIEGSSNSFVRSLLERAVTEGVPWHVLSMDIHT